MRKMLEHCPSCGGDLVVTRMSCPSCGTVIQGQWTTCKFCQLSPARTRLLEAFIRARGNVKEMARELDTSYWTVRKELDDLIAALGYEPGPPPEDPSARLEDMTEAQLEILDALDHGELTAAEAARQLQAIDSESDEET
jgi:hypothetical protein